MVGEARDRVLVVLATHWDARQLDACRDAWGEAVEPCFPEPDDVTCPSDFDVLGFIDRAVAGELGRIDGVMSSSDYPGATVAAAIATRLGLPGPRPECVIGASHKYYSRLAQRRAAPEAVPRFALVDPASPGAPAPLPFPFFVKPVKGAFSVLARRVDDAETLARLLASPAVREFTGDYMRIFNRLVAALTPFEVDGRWFLAEELVSGRLVTVEGFVCEGETELLGIVDSGLHAGTGSFERFDYPSSLPADVQARMADVARRVVRELGLDRSPFNIEMVWRQDTDRIAIIEVNPRLCGQFADLYQKVDGTHGYAVALDLCRGRRPRVVRGAGPYAAAASFPLRVYAPARVCSAPDAAGIARVEALFPGTLVWSECAAGDELADFEVDEDGASHRYAVVNLGAASREDLDARLATVRERLGYELAPLS
jgi:ATP-grasp domain